MKPWWMVAGCVLGLAACGGGGDPVGAGTEQTPFEELVSEARAQPLEQSCRTSGGGLTPPVEAPVVSPVVAPAPAVPEVSVLSATQGPTGVYSVLEVTESRVAASGKAVELLERESFHGTADCAGDALVSGQVKARGQPAAVMRIAYLNTLASAQVRRLDGSTFSTVVDRVEVAVNPHSGVYDFAFLSAEVAGSQAQQDFTTTATFTINGVSVTQTHEIQAPATAVLGLARLNGEVVNVLPLSEGVFQEVAD